MAYLPNPYYGIIPGAPAALNYWSGPGGTQFNMSGLPLPPPPPLPPVSTAATPTPQDAAAQSAFAPPRTDTGGAQPGGGGPGSGPGGLGGASGGGQDRTTSGYQGVYAQAPDELGSRFGEVGGLVGSGAGMIGGIPGIGTALGFGGGMLDAARYNGVNAQYGIPGNINPWGAGLAQALAGIGIPFTDMNLARALGVQTAQQRQNALLDAFGQPVSREGFGYGALAANQPVGTPTRESGTLASYPAGFIDSSLQPSHGMPAELAAALNLDAQRTIAANPDIFGSGPAAATASPDKGFGADFGSGATDMGGGVSTSGGTPDAGKGDSGGGDKGPGGGGWYAKGGLIGAPPGRYAAGGAVGRAASNAAVRRAPPPQEYSRPFPPPPDVMSDRDFYLSPFRPAPDTPHAIYGMGNPGGGAMRYVPAPGTADRMVLDPAQLSQPSPAEYYAPEGEASGMPGMQGAADQYYGQSYAVGGQIPPAVPGDNITPAQFGALRAINPPGPDDQIAAVKTGEGVLTAKAMSAYPGLLAAANAGTLDPGRVKGLLTPAGMGRKPRLVR